LPRGIAVHHRVGQDVGAIDRRPLALVDGHRVAVGDVLVLGRFPGHAAASSFSANYLADLRERATAGARRGKLSTAAEFERLLRRVILPAIGSREVDSLALPEIEAMHRSMRSTSRQANAAVTVTSAVLGYAERRGLRPPGVNPCRLVERLKERARRRGGSRRPLPADRALAALGAGGGRGVSLYRSGRCATEGRSPGRASA
jgi:hypothetical protein